jgi:hypothetical protein
MNLADDLLKDLTGIGAKIEPAGDRLILRAGPTAIPATLVGRSAGPSASLWQRLWPERILALPERMTTVGAKRR